MRNGVLASLKRADDVFDTDFLFGHGLGRVEMRLRAAGEPWTQANTAKSNDVRVVEVDDPTQPREVFVSYIRNSEEAKGIRRVSLRERFSLEGESLNWEIVSQTGPISPWRSGISACRCCSTPATYATR